MAERSTAEPGTVAVLYRAHLFGSADRTSMPAGLTVDEIVDRLDLPPRLRPFLAVAVGDRLVPRPAWHLTRPKPGVQMTALPVPQGGGTGSAKTARTAAMLALIAAAAASGQLAAAAAGGGLLGAAAGGAVSAAVGISGAFVPVIHIGRRPPA